MRGLIGAIVRVRVLKFPLSFEILQDGPYTRAFTCSLKKVIGFGVFGLALFAKLRYNEHCDDNAKLYKRRM